jgi:hypothetical protein
LASKHARILVESPRFSREREHLTDARRFDEAMRAIDYRLSREPEAGLRVSRSLYATCISFPDGRTFAIFYTFDAETVVLQSIRPDRIISDW